MVETITVEAKMINNMSAALKTIETDMRRLEHTSYESMKTMEKALDQTEKASKRMHTSMVSGMQSFAAGTIGLVAGAFAFHKLTNAIEGSIEAARSQRAADLDLQATLKSTGGAAGVTFTELTKMASGLQKVTNFEDDAIERSQAMLLTFTKIGKEVFPEATEATLNMATKFKTDAAQAAIQLGKALNDPINGVTALRRVGVALNDQQEAQIKTFVKTNNLAAAQKIILAELNTEFGGLARATADPFTQFQNQIGEVKESIGFALLPALETTSKEILKIIDAANDSGDMQAFFGGIGEAATMAAKAVSFLGEGMSALNRMESRAGGTGFGDLEKTKQLKSELEEIKKLQKEMANPEAQSTTVTDGFGRRVRQSEDLTRRIGEAKGKVEEIAGTVAAPGILANLDKNISALEHRLTKMKADAPPVAEEGKAKAAKVSTAPILSDEQKKAVLSMQEQLDKARIDAMEEGVEKRIAIEAAENRKRLAAAKDIPQALQLAEKTHQQALANINEAAAEEKEAQAEVSAHRELLIYQKSQNAIKTAHEKEIKEAIEADERRAEQIYAARARHQGTEVEGNPLAELKLRQDQELESYKGNEIAITELKRAHEIERRRLVQDTLQHGVASVASNLKTVASQYKSFSGVYKVMAHTQNLIDTYASATASYKAMAGIPIVGPGLGAAAAAAAVAAGLANASAINSQHFALGTLNAPGGRALVGEKGPEYVDLPKGARVYDHNQTERMMGQGGGITHTGDVVFQIAMPPGSSEADARSIGESVGAGYRDYLGKLHRDIKNIQNLRIPEMA